jgi:hypothetical protein
VLWDSGTKMIYSTEVVMQVLNQLQQDSKINKINTSILEAFPLYVSYIRHPKAQESTA